MIDTELARYGAYGIALASLSALVFLVTKFLAAMEHNQKTGAEFVEKLRESIDANTKVGEETYSYLKMRNGSGDRLMQELSGKLDRNYEVGMKLDAHSAENDRSNNQSRRKK